MRASGRNGWNTKRSEREIRERAARYTPQTHLTVDYYRIRRKVAYPLPVREMALPRMPVPGISAYPWATWMTWALENPEDGVYRMAGSRGHLTLCAPANVEASVIWWVFAPGDAPPGVEMDGSGIRAGGQAFEIG